MLHREARSLNARSCNYPTTCALPKPRRNNHANLREDRCNSGRHRRNRSRQRSSSRSLAPSSLLPSSLWLLPSPSLIRLSPLLPSSLPPPSLLVLARSSLTVHRCNERDYVLGLIREAQNIIISAHWAAIGPDVRGP